MPGHIDILLRLFLLSGNKFTAALFRFVLTKVRKFSAFYSGIPVDGSEMKSILRSFIHLFTHICHISPCWKLGINVCIANRFLQNLGNQTEKSPLLLQRKIRKNQSGLSRVSHAAKEGAYSTEVYWTCLTCIWTCLAKILYDASVPD
jgi:hypothetical protein